MGLAKLAETPLTVPGRVSGGSNVLRCLDEVAVSSPIRPGPDPSQLSVMFWLPPGGTDNGVWASNWAELADLDPADVAEVLAALADAGVGGYTATPAGRASRLREQSTCRLWVDSLQYHRAEDVLMTYLGRRHPHMSRS